MSHALPLPSTEATITSAPNLPTSSPAKPRLRGWIHLATAPLALVVGVVLTVLTPGPLRWTTAVFTATSVILFGMSAVYHLGTWTPRVRGLLRRFDHANIFLLIAGTYTPLSCILLEGGTRSLVFWIVWIGAIAGLITKVSWMRAPRWLYVLIYIALGWVAIWFLPAFWQAGGPTIVWLIIAGGVAYTLGAVAYALKRPNPAPGWFGFHEIFHSGTVIGWACHMAAVFLAVLALR